VKGAIGQSVDAETLGGASMHTSTSGVAHYLATDDSECLELIRRRFRELREPPPRPRQGAMPRKAAEGLYDVMPSDHRAAYDISEVIDRVFDAGDYLEFQPEYAPEMLCATARLSGHPVGLITNRRGFLKSAMGPRVGGIVYTESARKVAYFVDDAERHRLPLLYIQDVSGFMVGVDAEREGIIRAGAEMVETMACATVPKIVLTVNHASGAGYYAMAGQGFDPHFTFGWPSARIGVMEGESAVRAIHGVEMDKFEREGKPLPQELQTRIEKTRADYERWLDARYAAARGHVDALIDPLATRRVLTFALEVALYRSHPEHTVTETM
jgi:acetyl-CoA carboxylase carboxyltransferase component